MYRWASPLEDERQIAMRYWKKATESPSKWAATR